MLAAGGVLHRVAGAVGDVGVGFGSGLEEDWRVVVILHVGGARNEARSSSRLAVVSMVAITSWWLVL